MGLLNRQDARIYRQYFSEMCRLIGISVGYQYVVKKEFTIHSEDNSEYSMPIRIDVLFDENPSTTTLNRLGWMSELSEQKPIIVNMPYNTPNLTVNARIMIESTDGVSRPRLFRITNIVADLEYPDAYTCSLVPIFDQIPQFNNYNNSNTEKISEQDSINTSIKANDEYITGTAEIDTVPEELEDEDVSDYEFIDSGNSPYSG